MCCGTKKRRPDRTPETAQNVPRPGRAPARTPTTDARAFRPFPAKAPGRSRKNVSRGGRSLVPASAEHFKEGFDTDLELFGIGRGVVGDDLKEGDVQFFADELLE